MRWILSIQIYVTYFLVRVLFLRYISNPNEIGKWFMVETHRMKTNRHIFVLFVKMGAECGWTKEQTNEWLLDNNFSGTTNDTIRYMTYDWYCLRHSINLPNCLARKPNEHPVHAQEFSFWNSNLTCSNTSAISITFLPKPNRICFLSERFRLKSYVMCIGFSKKRKQINENKTNNEQFSIYNEKVFFNMWLYTKVTHIVQHQMNILMKFYSVLRIRN